MSSDSTWRAIRERIADLDADDVLVTPEDERVFTVEADGSGWIEIQFRDGRQRTLPREQLGRLADQIDGDGTALDDLPPGVGPYVSLLTLVPAYRVDGGRIVYDAVSSERDAGAEGDDPEAAVDAPFVRSQWDVRRPPERVHDDALLLAALVERHDALDPESLATTDLVDLYVLLSDVQRGSDDLRRDVSEVLLEELGPDGRERGTYGTVSRVRRERQRPKDDEAILEVLDDAGVPREWVLGVDREKLDVVLATTDVDEADVYDEWETYHVRKTGVESEAKRSRLEGLKEQLDESEGEETDELREEVEDLEERIEDVLSAS